jgi:Mce-associated membrane protein
VTTTTHQEPDADDIVEDPPDADTKRAEGAGIERSAGHWKRNGRRAVVATVFVVVFSAAGLLGWKLWDEHLVDEAGQAARKTAIDYAQVLTSIDSNNVDQNFAAVLGGATGEFKDMYTKASGQLRQLLIDNKAAAHAVVVDSAIQSESKRKVVVLLMVDQTVTNTARPDGRVDRTRMKLTMEKVDGRWLASKVELP